MDDGRTSLPLKQWGRGFSVTLREALLQDDYAAAERLARHGDGQTRSLAKEFAFMIRGLDVTIQILLRLIGKTIEHGEPAGDSDAGRDVVDLLHRFGDDLAGWMGDGSVEAVGREISLAEELHRAARAVERCRIRFEEDQAQLADEIIRAIEQRDRQQALALMDAKVATGYRPLHDRLVRFMADSFGWVLRHYGARELLRFHLATAEGQRAGFEKWEEMSAAEFAWTTAFLLKQHMGEVEVSEDAEKFTINQSPCGSGGRLRLDGAYDGAAALPYVTGPGPLTFGKSQLPVYCSHCAIWNGTATLRWFGRAQWVFDDPARSDGSCTLHIYKTPESIPAEYHDLISVRT